ncbi:ankyrin repeat domain-containing protein 26-like isoform X1 [Camelus bactrianus]|uniref:Ankyrin repeat domain-containing protein 26-like isoform X1 n=2 Tax=Camelus bactrianus TaxID=9837 RepID=A0AC58P4X9_CAMBA
MTGPGEGRPRTALHLACTSGQSSVVALLIQWKCDLGARDEEGKTALIKAVQCRKELCVTVLLEHGADPNLVDDCQNTALHYAVLAEDTSIAAKLLRYKANIEAINKYKYTPLLLAIRENREEMVKFLIANGANVHAVDKLQRSALMLAVHHDSPDIVKLLLEKRVNTDLLDVHGWFAGRYACNNGFKHLYRLIVDYRAGRIPNTPPQNSDLGQSSENIQGKLQLSGKDDEEEMVVELGTSNGSRMDPLKNVEQKSKKIRSDLVVEFSPRFEDISVIGISPRHDVDDSRPPSDGDLDLAPKEEATKPKTGGKENSTWTINSVLKEQADHRKLISTDGAHKIGKGDATPALRFKEKKDAESSWVFKRTSKIQLPNYVDDLSGAAGLGEKNTLNGQIENSDRLLKIEDPVHSFRSIELKESDCELVRGETKKKENKMNWLHTELLKTREAKSQLKLQNVEWEQELCSMRFTSKQETKKKKNAYILYGKTKDDSKRKEKECNEQASANQQLESTARALECKPKSIRNKPNQVLEARNDAERQLSREQNARVIQDEILAHHQQKEAEKTNKMNAEDTMDFELSDPKDSSEVLPQQLPEAERQFRGQEIELHPRRDALRQTTLVLECVRRNRGEAQHSNKETEPLSQSKQGKVNKYIGKQAFLEERVFELQSENVLLRQQLDVAQNEAKSKKTILNIPEPFLDHMGKLEAMSRRVLKLEEGNKELINECQRIKERLYQYETDRAEMEACMRQLQQELTDTRKKVSMLEASLEVTAHHHTNSENEKQESERRSHQTANPNADLPAKVKSASSVLLHLGAETQRFLKEIFMKELQKKSDTLEEKTKQLEEEVVHLRHHLEMNAVERSPVERYQRETEERARRDVVEKLKELSQVVQYRQETEEQARQHIAEKLEEISQFLQAQAASQEDLLREYKRASVSQMEHRVKDLETELKSKTFQFDCNEKELEKYRQLYLEELENGMSLASQLNSANERLAAVSTELQLEKQHKSSLLGSVPARPVDGPPSDESSSTSVETERSLTRRRNFRNFSDPSTTTSDLFRMRKKLENNIDRELREAITELESKSYRLSRRLDGRVKSKSRSGFKST